MKNLILSGNILKVKETETSGVSHLRGKDGLLYTETSRVSHLRGKDGLLYTETSRVSPLTP